MLLAGLHQHPQLVVAHGIVVSRRGLVLTGPVRNGRARVSAPEAGYDESVPAGSSETVAGFLAAFAIFASLVALAWHPLRLIPFSMLIALVASAIGGRYQRLAFAAVMTTAGCFFFG